MAVVVCKTPADEDDVLEARNDPLVRGNKWECGRKQDPFWNGLQK